MVNLPGIKYGYFNDCTMQCLERNNSWNTTTCWCYWKTFKQVEPTLRTCWHFWLYNTTRINHSSQFDHFHLLLYTTGWSFPITCSPMSLLGKPWHSNDDFLTDRIRKQLHWFCCDQRMLHLVSYCQVVPGIGEGSGTHSSTLAWRIPWMEEPGGLQSMGSRRVGHNWATSLSLFPFMHWRRKWQPTPVFLPGESQGWGSLVGCRPWGHTESDTTEAT